MKTDYFRSCGHCWAFQVYWHIEWRTLTASPFRIWYISNGIPSPPLAFFIVMVPKAYLISHSKISVSSWVITQLWLSGSVRSFFNIYSTYACLLISSDSFRFILFLSLFVPIFQWNVLLVTLIFLKISLVFSILLLSSISLLVHLGKLSYLSLLFFGTLHSIGYIFPFVVCL